jgi:predicted NBD/HSP70 family sugar kinase
MPTGPGDVLELIRRGQAATRGEVLDLTGLSRMTVAQRVDALLATGLIVEGEQLRAASGGRRPRTLRLNVTFAHVIAATVDTTHTRTAVTDLAGRILAEDHLDVDIAGGPSATLDAIVASSRRLLAQTGLRHDDVCGLGLSLPGPVDPATGRPSQPPIMPGWDGYPVAEHLQATFRGLPVLTANDADAAALGEHAAGFPHVRSLCLVKVSTGIGTGIVIDGRPYRGADGGAGDIGHARLASHPDALCRCGARGCLAASASGRAVAQQLSSLGTAAASARDVGALLAAGDVQAARLTQDAGRLIGEVMATVVCVLNPAVVVVGGDLASAPLLAGIRETLYRIALPRATRHLTLQLGALGGDAGVVGLTRLVVDEQFSPSAVNARLSG